MAAKKKAKKSPAKKAVTGKRVYKAPQVKTTVTEGAVAALTRTVDSPEKAAITEASNLATRLKASATLMKVDSQETSLAARRMLIELKTARTQLEEKRKFLTRPMREAIDRTNGMFKPYVEALDEADKTLRQKMLEYQQQLTAARLAEEQRLLQEASEAQEEGDNDTALDLAVQATQLRIFQKLQLAVSALAPSVPDNHPDLF